MIKVLLADDHKMFTEGIASFLSQEPDIEVVGSCQDGAQVWSALQESSIDIVLLDINMGKESGLDICKHIVEEFPKTKVLSISMYSEESFIRKMFKNGASGYLLKNTGREELLKAIRTIFGGNTYQSAEVMEIVLKGMNRQKQQEGNIYNVRFSRREKEVLDLIAKGLTTKDIAKQLFISEKTVETHRSNLLAKLNVHNVASLIKVAVQYGYLS
ncbi:response regulator transcription factor [Cytophagaceae bacterium YF14B1]|uniref:Response regulator transcription factor n=1 Tax=Xanthocytophaga flava TaxID=3048013 RepID=A0AAE3QY66_9BACT|nr:response regulator transcription factor [Xanthocytophaga flavus]MDJ1485720.1 response regulator transcription factor [Xanthocytophaga flavus]